MAVMLIIVIYGTPFDRVVVEMVPGMCCGLSRRAADRRFSGYESLVNEWQEQLTGADSWLYARHGAVTQLATHRLQFVSEILYHASSQRIIAQTDKVFSSFASYGAEMHNFSKNPFLKNS